MKIFYIATLISVVVASALPPKTVTIKVVTNQAISETIEAELSTNISPVFEENGILNYQISYATEQ